MTSRVAITDAIVAALLAASTMAGTAVYAARDWPLTEPSLPAIKVKAIGERKESLGRHLPEFNSTASIVVLAMVSGATSQDVEANLETICGQIELAVLTAGGAVQSLVQQFTSVDIELRSSSAGAVPIGEAEFTIACEFFQLYGPTGGVPLAEIGFDFRGVGDAAFPAVDAGANDQTPSAAPDIQP